MSHTYDKSELAFQAFRYISDEMIGDEREQFEELLATSQEAREEVAAAVELSQAVALAESRPAVALPSTWATWSNRVRWMLVGTAACLAVVGVSKLMQQAGHDAVAKRHSDAAQSLAVAWLDSQVQADDLSASDENTEETVTADPSVDELTAIEEEVVLADDVAVPGWLLAAVNSEKATTPEEAPGALEN